MGKHCETLSIFKIAGSVYGFQVHVSN